MNTTKTDLKDYYNRRQIVLMKKLEKGRFIVASLNVLRKIRLAVIHYIDNN